MKIAIKLIVAALVFYSCNSAAKKESLSVSDVALESVKSAKPEEQSLHFTAAQLQADTTTISTVTLDSAALQGNGGALQDWDKKIIKTAQVSLELKDYNTYNTGIHARLKSYGAYIAQEQLAETDYKLQNDVVIKVPVEKFDELLSSLGGTDIKVLSKNISSDDVTAELVDTKARIEAKQQVRLQYLQLLKQAKNMADILQVQNEINTIQEDLEAAQGRVKYLSHQAAYSTVNLSYFQFINGGTPGNIQPSFFLRVKDAFATGALIISNTFLFAISVWPLLVAGILLGLYYKRMRIKKA